MFNVFVLNSRYICNGGNMEHGKMTTKLAKLCKNACPICKRGRENGKGFLYTMVKLERHICPACLSYEKVYGLPAHKKIEEPETIQK
jgi:hypothetical protein